MCTRNQLNIVMSAVAKDANQLLGDMLDAVVLYGSYARGDFTRLNILEHCLELGSVQVLPTKAFVFVYNGFSRFILTEMYPQIFTAHLDLIFYRFALAGEL